MQKMWLFYEVKDNPNTSKMSNWEVVKMSSTGMYKSEVIKIMTDAVIDMQRQAGRQVGASEKEIQKMVDDNYMNINMMNNIIYDKLKDLGLLVNN